MQKEAKLSSLGALDQARVPSVTDMVYDELYRRIVDLDLVPGTKLSEAEVASRLEVSRQPVRDAFYRLSQQGFLSIRPQRATTVTPISPDAVLQARFIRMALEVEIIREAVRLMTPAAMARLEAIVAAQKPAVESGDRERFHERDDALHMELCEIAGQPQVWQLIKDNKAHMDRVRYLSLEDGARLAYDEHLSILEAVKARDPDLAVSKMRDHLMRIGDVIPDIRAKHAEYFEQDLQN
ncbi:GntR family transcriptional regulator [Celeribacter arenosi]|uniref:GntR family transcriptional regulator n=1 Tax=Celeribacter arenosi TaxID=792649 RepID=A0ABP7KE08_9RHOB